MIAEEAAANGCSACGGRLHAGNFPRKARGVPLDLAGFFEDRFSYCCSNKKEGCRTRLTPDSVRFLGRRVFVAAVVVTLSALLEQGLTARRFARVLEVVDVSRRTLVRWIAWWRDTVPVTRFWLAHRPLLGGIAASARLPGSIIARFPRGPDRLLLVLRFLAPLGAPSNSLVPAG